MPARPALEDTTAHKMLALTCPTFQDFPKRTSPTMKLSDYKDAGGWGNTVKGLCAFGGLHPRFYASFYRSFCPSRRHVCSLGTPSFILIKSSGSNSVVECDLAKVEVAGSNPVSRSSFLKPCPGEGFSF